MITTAKAGSQDQKAPSWHEPFLAMLPTIRRQAWIAFRHLNPEARADAIQEVVDYSLTAFVRLIELGKADLAYPTPLASFGIRQFRAGRRVGSKSNSNDVGSPYAQIEKGIRVKRLDHRDEETGEWKEILLEDRHAGPAETAAARIDFGEWLRRLPRRQRRIAEVLATGESTKRAARRFRVTPGRISQVRRELKDSWDGFQGMAGAPAGCA